MRIIITEKQFRELLENSGVYLKSNGTKPPVKSLQTSTCEITPSNNASDDDTQCGPVTDKIALRQQNKNHPLYRPAGGTLSRNRPVVENTKLDTKKGFSDKESMQVLSTKGGKMAKDVHGDLSNGGITLNKCEVYLNRLKTQKKEDPNTYRANGGEELEKILRNVKKNVRNIGRNERDTQKRLETQGLLPQKNQNLATPNAQKGRGKRKGEKNAGFGEIYYEKKEN